MLNQVVLVGRLVKNLTIVKTESGKKIANFTLAVPRSFKNVDGTYDTDFIDCVAWEMTAKNTAKYCHKGDVLGIKGRLQTSVYEQDGKKKYRLEVIAEKITFLTKKDEVEIEVTEEKK